MKTYWDIREAFATMAVARTGRYGPERNVDVMFDIYKNPTSIELSKIRKKPAEKGSGFHNTIRGLLNDNGDCWVFSPDLLHHDAKWSLKDRGISIGYPYHIFITFGSGSNKPTHVTTPDPHGPEYYVAAEKAFPGAKAL